MKFTYDSPVNLKDNLLRVAILEANKSQCLYCNDPLLLPTLELDHIISKEAYKNDQLAKTLEELKLPSKFHIDSPYNLAPSCRRCNNIKSGELLLRPFTERYLKKVSDNIDLVEKHYHNLKKSKDINKAIATLSNSISDSILSVDQIYNSVANEESEFKVIEELFNNKMTISTKTIYSNAFLPTIDEPRGSCVFVFKSLKIRDCMITFSHEGLKNIISGPEENLDRASPKFIVHQDEDKSLIQLGNNRFYLTREECSDLTCIIHKLYKEYTSRESAVIATYRLPSLRRSTQHQDGFRLLKIRRELWIQIIRFSHEFDVNNGASSWHLFESKNGHLVVFSRKDTDDLDAGYHTFLYPEEDDQYSAVSCLQDKDIIWIVWKPVLIHSEEFSPRKSWDAATAHDWFCNKLIPQVTEYYKSRTILGKTILWIKNQLKNQRSR